MEYIQHSVCKIASQIVHSLKIIFLPVFSIIFKGFSPIIFWILGEIEQVCTKVADKYGGSCPATLKFSLNFPNGQTQEVAVNTNGSCRNGSKKRVKLLLDINHYPVPDEKYEIIAVKNVRSREESRLRIPVDWFLQMMAYYTLLLIKFIQECIEKIERFIHPGLAQNRNRNRKPEKETRKKLSPRKKIRKSTIPSLSRLISKAKKFIGLADSNDSFCFDPIEGVADTSLNGSLNNSRLKATEKRKHPTCTTSESDSEDFSDSSDYSSSDASETKTCPVFHTHRLENGKQSLDDNKEIHEQSGEVTSSEFTSDANKSTQEADINLDTSTAASTSFDTENTDNAAEGIQTAKKNYFDVDDDYKSADDPDYVPSPHGSSSSEGSSGLDEETEQRRNEEVKADEEELNQRNGEEEMGQIMY